MSDYEARLHFQTGQGDCGEGVTHGFSKKEKNKKPVSRDHSMPSNESPVIRLARR